MARTDNSNQPQRQNKKPLDQSQRTLHQFFGAARASRAPTEVQESVSEPTDVRGNTSAPFLQKRPAPESVDQGAKRSWPILATSSGDAGWGRRHEEDVGKGANGAARSGTLVNDPKGTGKVVNDADEESDDEYIGEDVWSEEVCSDDACSEDDDSEDDIDEGGRKAILDRESVDFLAGEFCALLQRQRKRAEALEAAAGDGHDLLKAVVATQRASAQDEPLVENDEVWGQVEPMQQLLNALVRKPFAPLDMCGKLGAMR